jgi:hypothetical protein
MWVPVYIGSVLVLMGGANNKGLIAVGAAMICASFIAAVWLALGPWRDRSRPPWYTWAILAGAVVYAVIALGAGITSGWRYAVAGVLAAIVPLTALALTLAMHRRGVLGTADAEPRVVTDERETLERLKRSEPRPHY